MLRERIPQVAKLILVLSVVGVLTPSAPAQSQIAQSSVDRAHKFLATAERGKAILGFVHFGASYKGHAYRAEEKGQVVPLNQPGHFAMVYRFKWENDGLTDIAVDCDAQGSVYQVRVLSTNAILQQPYALANASISVVGNLIVEAFREKMTAQELQQVRGFIDNPNARALLEINLKLQQAFGK